MSCMLLRCCYHRAARVYDGVLGPPKAENVPIVVNLPEKVAKLIVKMYETVKMKFGKFMGNKMCKYDRINIRKKRKKETLSRSLSAPRWFWYAVERVACLCASFLLLS